MLCNMAMMKKKDKMTRGQKAESKRMTAQGVSEAKARLAFIEELKKANPGIGFKIPKKQEKELKTFVGKYGKPKPKKAQAPKKTSPKTQAEKKPQPRKMGPTPLNPLFNPGNNTQKAFMQRRAAMKKGMGK